MKKFLILALTLIMGGRSFANGSGENHTMIMTIGQDAPLPVYFTGSKNFELFIRHLMSTEYPASTAVYIPDIKKVNARAQKDFQQRFKDVKGAMWYSDEDGIYSYFNKDGFNNRAFYNKNGNWQYSIVYKMEDKLPRDLRTAIKSVYFDWNINVAEEIRTTEGMIYFVYLEDKSNFRVLKVSGDNEVETFENISKQ